MTKVSVFRTTRIMHAPCWLAKSLQKTTDAWKLIIYSHEMMHIQNPNLVEQKLKLVMKLQMTIREGS